MGAFRRLTLNHRLDEDPQKGARVSELKAEFKRDLKLHRRCGMSEANFIASHLAPEEADEETDYYMLHFENAKKKWPTAFSPINDQPVY